MSSAATTPKSAAASAQSEASRKRKTTEEEEEEDEDKVLDFREERGTIGLRLLSWNLEGAERAPAAHELLPLLFKNERCIKAFALQEVKCLEALRGALWENLGGAREYEIFEHWMGRANTGPGLTVLLVFAPVELVRTGQFRLSRFQHVVKREVLNGQRFKFGLGATSSRGAVSMPFSFLDTTFSLCSLRLTENSTTELAAEVAQRDLDKILTQCCNVETEWRRSDSLHHVFAAGTFLSSSAAPAAKAVSLRKSMFRASESSLLPKSSAEVTIRERFPALDVFEEMDSNDLAFNADHVFYRSASVGLKENCLRALQSQAVQVVTGKRAALSTLFSLSGRGQDLLSLYSRITGNLPLHLSTRSNFHTVNTRKQRAAQKPKVSSAREIQANKALTSAKYLPHCTRCALEIADEERTVPVTQEGSPYHAACFTCDDCGKSLFSSSSSSQDISFHEVDGRIYCAESYQRLFVNNCAACNGALGEEFLVMPDGRRFHVSCHRCLVCSRPFATKQQQQDDDLTGTQDMVIEAAIPYENGYLCLLDFNNLMGKKTCKRCEKNFEHVVTVNGVAEDGGERLLCLDCFWEEHTSACFRCKLAIDDGEEVLEYGGVGEGEDADKTHCCHVSCLQCVVCKRSIQEFENGALVEFEGNMYCQRDWSRFELASACALCDKQFHPGQERIHTQDKMFHASCFHCVYCHCAVNNKDSSSGRRNSASSNLCMSRFARKPKEEEAGMAFWCAEHFAKIGPECCARCQQAIRPDERRAVLLGLSFHAPQCFTCSFCGQTASNNGAPPFASLPQGKLQCDSCRV